VVRELLRKNIQKTDEFDWIAQLRYEMDEKKEL